MLLKKLRLANSMTQKEVADACGVIPQTISNIENGLAKPSVELAKKLGKLFKIEWARFYDD